MLSPVVIAAAGTVLLLTVALHSHGSSPVPAPHCHNTVTSNLLKTDPAQQLLISRDAKQQSDNTAKLRTVSLLESSSRLRGECTFGWRQNFIKIQINIFLRDRDIKIFSHSPKIFRRHTEIAGAPGEPGDEAAEEALLGAGVPLLEGAGAAGRLAGLPAAGAGRGRGHLPATPLNHLKIFKEKDKKYFNIWLNSGNIKF